MPTVCGAPCVRTHYGQWNIQSEVVVDRSNIEQGENCNAKHVEPVLGSRNVLCLLDFQSPVPTREELKCSNNPPPHTFASLTSKETSKCVLMEELTSIFVARPSQSISLTYLGFWNSSPLLVLHSSRLISSE